MNRMFAFLFGVLVIVLLSLVASGAVFAGDKEELQWKIYGLTEHQKVLAVDFQTTQMELKDAQGKLEAILKAEATPKEPAKTEKKQKPVFKK